MGYAHATELTEAAIARAAEAASSVRSGHKGDAVEGPAPTNWRLYSDANPLSAVAFGVKTSLLAEIDAYARAKDPRVKQVSCSLFGEWQVVHIRRAGGQVVSDIRPLVRLNVSVVVEQDGREESRAATARAGARAMPPSSTRAPGRPMPTRRCARRSSIWRRAPPLPAKCRSFWGRAGPASARTERLAMAGKAIST